MLGRAVSMKRYIRAGAAAALFLLLLMAVSFPVQAGVVNARKTSLVNVTEARTRRGQWVKVGSKVQFQTNKGRVLKNRWINFNGLIFYLDSSGYRVKGWVKYRDQYYYIKSKYGLYTGLLERKGKLYYLQEDGTRASGLCSVDGDRYYFDEKTGAAVSGWKKIGKYQYYFQKKSFIMQRSAWVKTNGKYYYVKASGRKRSQGWMTLKGNKYYLDSDGARVTGNYYIDGKGYYFAEDGVYDASVEVKAEVDTSKPMVALTFDDGPGAYTGRLLDCLEENQSKATFFMVGTNVSKYSSVVKRMASLGCELGNHSWSHPYMSRLSASGRASEVSKTSAAIKSAAGASPTVFRLPYGDGHSSSSVLSSLGLPSIYWSMDTRDWANTGNPQHTVNAVLNNVKDGDIILMHDIHFSTVQAAETIIPSLVKRGYQLVTVSQLAKYKGKTTLQTGRTYYNFY